MQKESHGNRKLQFEIKWYNLLHENFPKKEEKNANTWQGTAGHKYSIRIKKLLLNLIDIPNSGDIIKYSIRS